ncbi:winged helix-turn-helix transcriptional regulator, partial [Neobacillus drentensis]|uniref:winged helix-turn-helix transcriptional regulator n=1 Tax=Neobacillus drentensis TaxID=220684 RepID=UPI003B58995E
YIWYTLYIVSTILVEVIVIKICPYLEYSFQILGKKWNGLIIHYLSLCENNSTSFTEMVQAISNITPRVLSMRLTELIEYGLVKKDVIDTPHVTISYKLTEKGQALVSALQPIQNWAIDFKDHV